ncbi:MAG: VIT domain-containing protein [Ignavibacteria bacterium]|jgi:Ca-activated chloride channel family protein
MKRILQLLPVVFILIILFHSEVLAVGSLFSRPRWSNVTYEKMWIKNILTDVEINNQIAITHQDQTFYNESNESVEAIFVFPLPENATITEMIYWVNGNRFVADIRERQEAVNEYNQKLQQWLDPALLEYLGDNLFRLSIVPIDPLSEVRVEITYAEPLFYEFGKINYTLPLNTLDLSSQPLEEVMVEIDAVADFPFKTFYSPSHENSTALQITQISDKEYSLFYGDENYYPDTDLFVEFELEKGNIDFTLATYTPSEEDSIGEDSFYALWVNPPFEEDQEQVIPQSIIFTADVSSSMEGTRLDQLKSALAGFVELLGADDRFNIVTFGTFVNKFSENFIYANSDNKSRALNYINQLSALGLTNISEALNESLNQSFDDQFYNSIVFLTDGNPTWGQTSQDSILAGLEINNTNNVRIFSFGIGDEISKALLTEISENNRGYATFIESDDSISTVVGELFLRISKPVLTSINIDLGGLYAWDIFPATPTDLFFGTQQIYLGKYRNGGLFNVELSGKLENSDFSKSQSLFFPDTIGGHRFVPRLWAKEKINEILNLIEIFGETDELVNQVIELSLMFQILTPYTAFYADDDDDPTTSIDDDPSLPDEFELKQNYPNPFNPSTTIEYTIPISQSLVGVTLKIYNTLGQLVKVLVNTNQANGTYTVVWKGLDSQGNQMPSGIYFYVLQSGDVKITKKMILLR